MPSLCTEGYIIGRRVYANGDKSPNPKTGRILALAFTDSEVFQVLVDSCGELKSFSCEDLRILPADPLTMAAEMLEGIDA